MYIVKKYIFFVYNIGNITGLHQYMYSKMQFLKENGWEIIIFSSRGGNILIQDFKKYADKVYPAMLFTPMYNKKSYVNSIIEKIIADINYNKDEQIIIESTNAYCAVWAEMIASRLRCKNFIYLVQETHKYGANMKRFLKYKFGKCELAGITKQSVFQMFPGEMIREQEEATWTAVHKNVIDNCEDTLSHLLDTTADYTLGTFGRLSKPYLPFVIKSFLRYVQQNHNKRYNIVIIGGDERKEIEEIKMTAIRNSFCNCHNVNLIFTGNVYPVPLSFVKKINVFVSSAGSAYATYHKGIPTIMVNPTNGEPVGVMGLDFDPTQRNWFESVEGMIIGDCIDKILSNNDQIKYTNNSDNETYARMNNEFQRQLRIASTNYNIGYYDEKQLLKIESLTQPKHAYFYMLIHILGNERSLLVMSLWKRIKYKILNTI